MSNRVSNEQLEELLDFLTEHPALAKGVGLGARSKETVDKQWHDLANKLNSYGSGSTKSGERWKKYWADLKHKSKTRLAKRRRDALGTGGGPSSQEDLSEIDKKVLAIIGEQAVFGDSVHRIPIFNIETDIQGEQIDPQSEQIVHVQVHNSETEEFQLTESPLMVNSPSRRGQTSRVFADADNIIENDPPQPHNNVDTVRRQTPHPPQTGVESPVSRPIADRRRLRRNSSANTSIPSRINPEWVMELENRRVEAESRLANAAFIMAEASRVQADTARAQADLTRELVVLIRRQSDDIKALLEIMRATNQP